MGRGVEIVKSRIIETPRFECSGEPVRQKLWTD
jgi:hypothetical protein